MLKRFDLSRHPLAGDLTRHWVRWRSWRLRHRLATELAAVAIGLMVFFGGSSPPAVTPDTMSSELELPNDWVVLAIAVNDPPGLERGDRVALLAEGSVVTTSATVADVLADSVTVALPLDIAPVVASAGNVVLARLNSPTRAQATSSTTTPSATR